jgi:hypothetical protein
MMKTTQQTGSEVLSYCSSCKMDLAATVVAKVGSKIARIQCRTCKKELAYRAPKGISDPTDAPPAKSARRPSTTESALSKKTVSVNEEWKKLMGEAGPKAVRIAYSPKKPLLVGAVVQHPNFGDGLVLKVIFPDKAEVLFEYDVKTLIHSKS